VAGRGVSAQRGRPGYLCLVGDGGLYWLGRRGFRARCHAIDLEALHDVGVERGILFDELVLRSGARTVRTRFTLDRRRMVEALAGRLALRCAAAATAA
jgi:hypothetical protein